MKMMKKSMWTALFVSTLVFNPAGAVEMIDVEPYRASALKRWANDIASLEARDVSEVHPENAILFVGSSSIRRWESIAADMAPYHPIQRGYGGAKWSDLAIFAQRLVAPHPCRAIVFFVGNDISGGKGDKTPDDVVALFANVLQTVRTYHPETPVFYIAVTPTRKRLAAWPAIREGNEHVRAYCAATGNCYFIGTESVFLDAQGEPRNEFFVEDKLHLNEQGYTLWSSAIKSQLDSVLGGSR
jgi:hypothetical protein